jgi:hypothetical protein
VRDRLAFEFHSSNWGKRPTPLRGWRTERWEYVETIGGDDELYDLDTDPEEARNLIDHAGAQMALGEMRAALCAWVERCGDKPGPRCPCPRAKCPGNATAAGTEEAFRTTTSSARWMVKDDNENSARNECVGEEFTVSVGCREIHPILLSPPKDRIAMDPVLLLNFTGRRDDSLWGTKQAVVATNCFLAQGHRVLGFDLPNFGSRIDKYGEAITGLRNAFVNGSDPFTAFVEDTVAVIDASVEHAWATPGRIANCGTSRGAYFALRAVAADPRIVAGAGFAPVTDWRI